MKPCICFMKSKGANPNEWDQSGFMPLHYASRANQTEAVRLLLQYGADPNGKTRAGATTPLHRAAFMGHIDIVKLLLAAKADSSLQDYDLTSPLHKAASQDHYDVIEILLKAGSRADVVDKNGAYFPTRFASHLPLTRTHFQENFQWTYCLQNQTAGVSSNKMNTIIIFTRDRHWLERYWPRRKFVAAAGSPPVTVSASITCSRENPISSSDLTTLSGNPTAAERGAAGSSPLTRISSPG